MPDETATSDIMNAILDMHAAMSHGFSKMQEQMDLRFGQADSRFGQIDARFDRLEIRLTSIEGDVRGIRTWMARADARFEALEARL